MDNKKVPPPPVLPPTITLNENFCLIHKGDIKGDFYTCPNCRTNYCIECAEKAKKEGKLCIKCKHLVLI
ncbi:MAG: hypothetical protein ACFE9S_12715 [Candidatus Hermodarchaeota archaeon]